MPRRGQFRTSETILAIHYGEIREITHEFSPGRRQAKDIFKPTEALNDPDQHATAVAGQKLYITQGLCSSNTGPERPSPSVFQGDKGPSQNCLRAVLLAFTATSLSMVYVYLESPECWLVHKGSPTHRLCCGFKWTLFF